jgi:alpha/beta hydrolase family protein
MTDPLVTPVPGKPNLLLGLFKIADLGYTANEFFISGAATSYSPSRVADYTTRIVVVRPTDAAAFNGTVIVEWLNVSAGLDAPALWFMGHRELVREGYAYVAVSAQQVGVQGGASMGFDMSLKTQDPERYSRLKHPGDAFSYDIYTQAGQLVRNAADNGVLGRLRPEVVVAVGESQSAMFMTTYVNAVDPVVKLYDGFLIHSRFGPAAPLDGASIFEAPETSAVEPVKFRTDLRAPVMTVITETDLLGFLGRLGYYRARQPDNEWLRTWEIPGTAHADNYALRVAHIDTGIAPLDQIIAAYAPTNKLMGQQLPYCVNFAPQHHYVLQAALAGLHTWIRTGAPPLSVPPIELTETEPVELILDANGIPKGGVRTPWVDVAIARTSGIATEAIDMANLFGSGEPFDTTTLGRLYPGGRAEYLDRFTESLDAAIRSGFLLSGDRQEILELAAAAYR